VTRDVGDQPIDHVGPTLVAAIRGATRGDTRAASENPETGQDMMQGTHGRTQVSAVSQRFLNAAISVVWLVIGGYSATARSRGSEALVLICSAALSITIPAHRHRQSPS
jgi:hypothetical protein